MLIEHVKMWKMSCNNQLHVKVGVCETFVPWKAVIVILFKKLEFS